MHLCLCNRVGCFFFKLSHTKIPAKKSTAALIKTELQPKRELGYAITVQLNLKNKALVTRIHKTIILYFSQKYSSQSHLWICECEFCSKYSYFLQKCLLRVPSCDTGISSFALPKTPTFIPLPLCLHVASERFW